jgi:hypothetical protein
MQTNISFMDRTETKTERTNEKFDISPEAIMTNTTIVDISDDFLWMERARWLTAESYVALADPKLGLRAEDVFETVSKDFYEEHGFARTVAALTTDPETGITEITGLVRVVIGARAGEKDIYPIDAMNFVQPLHGWPHEQNGLQGCQVAELGRFLIIGECRTPEMRRAGVPASLTRRLYEGGVEIMRSNHAQILYAIMPAYVARLISQAGIRIREIESRLKTEDPFAARIFDEFSLYWHRSSPKLYEWLDAPAPL